jgi:acyl-CoA thioesterase YciA
MTQPKPADRFPIDRQPAIRRVMMPRDTNSLGTIFGGTILAEIDLAAATEAHRYHPSMIVTIAMDKIEFKQPVFVGDLVSFFTSCTRIGRTSITVHVEVWAQRAADRSKKTYVTEASVTMVAVGDDFKPIPIQYREPLG